ncbi:hypothetical protein ACE1ET_07660 [Saccharicrinis sp. FJH62]|uniref:hypothetical protein n=1 Tax=Saccharicrinis sp. FJH62 TaxID=3344657 RepID=UPI0035D4A184
MQVTTLTILKFKGKEIFWMLPQMQLAKPALEQTKGLRFFKLLGSGRKGGFSVIPDFTTFAILCVWDNETFADTFFNHSDLFQQFKSHSKYAWTVFMHAANSRGSWSKQTPFTDFSETKAGIIAVITRATIKWNHVPRFWTKVPAVRHNLKQSQGLIFSIGIGEYPLFMQVTFSLWKDRSHMAQFAYRNEQHMKAVQMTRQHDWFREDLFANFTPFKTLGSWNGNDPLEEHL